jgi:signal transduction histidine kinase
MPAGRAAFTVGGMRGKPVTSPPWAGTGLQAIGVTAGLAVLSVAVLTVALALPGQSGGVIAGASITLAVAVGATIFALFWPNEALLPDLIALFIVGLAGLALFGLLPGTAGVAVVYLALAGLGMRAPPAVALVLALVLLVLLNLVFLLVVRSSVADLISNDIGVVFVYAVGAFTRSSRIAQEQARAAQARAEDLLEQLQASQAARAQAAALTERARLAREIHDILAHSLSGLILALDTMELLGRQAPADPGTMDRVMQQVSRAQRIARGGLADTRRAISALRGDELPGPALLERLVNETAAATGMQATLSVAGQERPLPPEVGLALYRTAQEALTNTAKYSGQGARAELRLRYEDEAVELVIEDARPDRPAPTVAGVTFGGYGLTGMRERAELLGGSLTAGPTDQGFCVRVWLPASADAVNPLGAAPANGAQPAPTASSSAARPGLVP